MCRGGLCEQAGVEALHCTLQLQQCCQNIWRVILNGPVIHMLLQCKNSFLHAEGVASEGRAGQDKNRAGQGRAG